MLRELGSRVQSLGFRVQDSGVGFYSMGLKVKCSGFRVDSSGLRVKCSGLKIWASGFRVQEVKPSGRVAAPLSSLGGVPTIRWSSAAPRYSA